ncbi:uncharacterized protein LOC121794383 [Salvia splendens]|nr:uncharacterized protein LOC121794383 [Salvia splendens]
MNGTSNNGKSRNFEKTYPGCLGRMVNLFEVNIGVSADRLLTDKPHRDGSPVSRSRSDVSSMSPSFDQIEEKAIVSEYPDTFSNKKTNVKPVKMLIAQEMCKEVDSRRSPPNLVAKLMGLDSLPQQEPGSATQRNHSKGHPRRHSEIPMSNWEQQNGFFHYVEPNEFKDVYEIWQESKKSTRKGRYDEPPKDKKMAFVRQKFVEAKRLSMDEKLRQSKQFQDALEVLNSNKDLFLKCLQEPNSAFSQQLYDLQSIPPPPETKRITVLRPSKMAGSHDFAGAGNREEKQMEKCVFGQLNGLERGHLGNSPSANWKNYENPAQPTRIVVLKPSLGKILDDKVVGSPQSQSARVHDEEVFGNEEDNEVQESREVAKAITQQMREKLGRHHRDETLISSVFSNGYVADESSFNRSEIEYPAGNLSDSEAVSPVSRHSWDYVNRIGSPFSSSFSRASYSPESSVCKEAKKRLSERWAMMASSGSCQEQRHVRRSSSTLGEMLALSETKKVASSGEEGSSNQETKDANSPLFSELRTNRPVDGSTINLTRSKSLPVSSNKLGTGIHADVPVSGKDKMEISKEDGKVRSSKSFKGKVSSFFSSRNKKTGKESFLASDTKDECRSCPGDIVSNKTESLIGKGQDSVPADLLETSIKASSSNLIFKQGLISPEPDLSMSEPIVSGNLTENQEQPSPISVLDPPFEECGHTTKVFPHYDKPDQHGYELPHNAISLSLIDKSPPIGSIARTLSWDDSCMDTASSYTIKESSTAQGTEEGEREWVLLVETLLYVAGLHGEMQSNTFLARWHSPESPLNPSLRDNYIDLNDEDIVHEAKRRQKRSMQKLVFDCVNAVLMDVAGYGVGPAQRAIPDKMLDSASSRMLEEVWARMSAWFSSELRCDGGDDNSLVIERVVRKEVVGSGWVDNLRLEVDNLGKEIEVKLLEELVEEAVVELTGRE